MSRVVANYGKVVTRDVNDQPTNVACWNHPEYMDVYDLDGVQWGAERMGPLMNVISPWNNNPPTCFCEHCRARGRAAGIDAERARQGYKALHAYVQGQMAGAARPPEGMFGGFLRVLIRYPEILELGVSGTGSAAKRSARRCTGESRPSSRQPMSAGTSIISRRAGISSIARSSATRRWRRTPTSSRSSRTTTCWRRGFATGTCPVSRSRSSAKSRSRSRCDLYYDLFGYDKRVEPSLAELGRRGFTPDYVFRETKRSVASADGKTKIYTGVGFDVPGSPRDDPETIYQAARKSFDAGAHGIVVSREYEEMQVEHLKADWTGISTGDEGLDGFSVLRSGLRGFAGVLRFIDYRRGWLRSISVERLLRHDGILSARRSRRALTGSGSFEETGSLRTRERG